jgi:hypothetical protein
MSELRYEIKFTCPEPLLPQVRSWIRLHPAGFRSTYPPRWVNSLYFDTPDLLSYQDNLRGSSSRQKLRLRWYGDLACCVERAVLELKLKDNLIGDKKRQPLAGPVHFDQPFARLLESLLKAAPPRWKVRLQSAGQPVLITRYQRDYYQSAEGHLRATLDYHIVTYDQRLTPRPNLTRSAPPRGLLVVELKAGPDHFEALQEAASALPLRRSRNSKYAGSLFTALQ